MSKQQLTETKKTATKAVKKSAKVEAVENTEQHEMIAREAYLRAEKRGFNGGDHVLDWLEAEKKVNGMLNS